MAIATLSPINPSAKSAVILALARLKVIKAIKQQVQARGGRVSELSAREFRDMADAYLAAHRQVLIEQATATIASRPTLRKFHEREQCRRAKLSINAQTAKPCSSSTISVQKLGAKWRANQ